MTQIEPQAEMNEKMAAGQGFIAALDQSGGSTPKALALYGVQENAYNDDSEMFDLIHAMRARIMTSPAFTGAKVIGAILFEQTMDREVEGLSTPAYLWQQKNVVPFLKIDKGLEDIADDVQRLRPINGLRDTLDRARALGVYGTKERSVIHGANEAGIKEIAAQQFELGREVLDAGLMPILEPEINIAIADKSEAEAMLRDALLAELDQMDRQVMLKLSIPTEANLYQPLVNHPNVLKVVALSGGYVRNEANAMLAQNNGMIASFSRALSEGLSADQSDGTFNELLAEAVESIHAASIT